MTTLKEATTKDEVAEILAQRHYEIEPGISRIVRLRGENEDASDDPIKLLEVNRNTVAAGIRPVYFGAHRIPFTLVIIEITPEEFKELVKGALRLPEGWKMEGRPYPKPRGAKAR